MSDTESFFTQQWALEENRMQQEQRAVESVCGNAECVCCGSGIAKANQLRELGNEMAAQLDVYQETIKALRDDRESYLVQLKQVEVLEATVNQLEQQLVGAKETIARLSLARKTRTIERIELSPGGHEMHVTDEVELP